MHEGVTRMGAIIRKAREAKGLTQAALAEETDSSIRTIIAIENSQRYPTCENFDKIIHALDISADLIFYPDQSPYTVEQDQFIREFFSCNEEEQRVIMATVRCLVRELRSNTINE